MSDQRCARPWLAQYEPAGAAGADARDEHPVAHRQGRDGRSDLGERADTLVAEDPAVAFAKPGIAA
jgi:hypothetical protein